MMFTTPPGAWTGIVHGMPRRRRNPPVPADLRYRTFTTTDGLTVMSRRRIDGPEFTTVVRGTRISSDQAVEHGDRIDGVLSRRRSPAVLLGPSAAWAHGCRNADQTDPVHLVGLTNRRGPGVVEHRVVLGPEAIVMTPYGPATARVRTAVDLARGIGTAHLDHVRRVAWIDAFCHSTGLTVAEVRRGLVSAAGLHGLPDARRVIADACDGVHSPKETELRLLIVTAGFPRPRTQCPVLLDGRIVARLDLGWEEYRVGLEYDGAVHRERRQHSKDLERHNSIRVAEWTVLQVDSRLLGRPDLVVARLARLVPRS